MVMSTREKMVRGTADLLKRRGLNATSLREVVRHTGTPRGSLAHHFPNGKQQLVSEAIAIAGDEVSVPLKAALEKYGTKTGLRMFISGWRQMLESSNYQAGCPVLAVALEEYLGEDATPSVTAQQQLLAQIHAIFADWQTALSESLIREGRDAKAAEQLATLIVAAVEGSVALCRAAKSSKPLEDVGAVVCSLV